MFKIVEKAKIAESNFMMKIEAPKIASKRKPGQFVMLRIDEPGERIPLTIAGSDTARGTITIIFQVAGDTTRQLSTFWNGRLYWRWSGYCSRNANSRGAP